MDGKFSLRGIGQVAASAFQASSTDQGPDRDVLVLEEAVQVAGGYVVCGGDALGRQIRVVQVPTDEGADSQDEGSPVSLGREGPFVIEDMVESTLP